MLEIKKIDPDEAARILALEEGHFLDFKRCAIGAAKLSETISALANTAGGEVYVGIDETPDKRSKTWNGFAKPEDANGVFQIIEKMTPLANHVTAQFLHCGSTHGYVLHILISKTLAILPAHDGTVFIRRNAQNLRVQDEVALARLRLDKGISSFEDDRVNVSGETITNSVVTIKFMLEVVPSAQPEEWMQKQNLIVDDRPIVAGVLLYSDEPQASLPKRSAIKVYRYVTKAEEGSREQLAFDPVTIEGCLYDQIDTAVTSVKKLVEGISVLGLESVQDHCYV